MENFSLLTTLGSGVIASFALFFLFYRGLRWNNKLAALVSILLVQAVYVPLAVIHWAGIDVFAIHFAFFVMSGYGLGIVTSQRGNRRRLNTQMGQMDQAEAGTETGSNTKGWFHWAPALIVGFFLTLAVVDSTIITLASKGASPEFMARFLPAPRGGGSQVSSAFPGAVSHDFQEKYAQFNHYMSQLETQRERGWVVENNGWQQAPESGKPAVFSLRVKDKYGEPLTGAEVEVSFLRPGDKRLDQTLALPEAGNGTYGQNVQLEAPGAWTVVVVIKRGTDVHEVKGQTLVGAPAG